MHLAYVRVCSSQKELKHTDTEKSPRGVVKAWLNQKKKKKKKASWGTIHTV